MHPKVESGKSRSVNLNLCARRPLPTKCVADVSQAVSTGQLDRAVPAHALAGHRISWHGRPCRVPPGRGVSSYPGVATWPFPRVHWATLLLVFPAPFVLSRLATLRCLGQTLSQRLPMLGAPTQYLYAHLLSIRNAHRPVPTVPVP